MDCETTDSPRPMTKVEADAMKANAIPGLITVQQRKVQGGVLLTGQVQWASTDTDAIVATQTDEAVAINSADAALRIAEYFENQTFQYEAEAN